MQDHFHEKANTYEQNESRVQNVKNIANAILEEIDFETVRHVMDFGAGTGLLLEQIAPHVDKITAVDISPAMIRELSEKQDRLACELDILNIDLTKDKLDRKIDGIVSSMTMHHIEDIPGIFRSFYELLDRGGFIALADLDMEDGTFHNNAAGVHHLGFDHDLILGHAKQAGFRGLTLRNASMSKKPQGDYPIFLLTAWK